MTFFRDFTVPLWEIFGGNLLMFAAIVFYIGWWTISKGDVTDSGAGFFMALAFFTGVAAIAIMSPGICSLSQEGKGVPVKYILFGAAAFYLILLAVTKIAFQRMVTSELLLIIVWTALEWSAIAVLQRSSRLGTWQVLTLAALVALATATGIVSYILHYNLDEPSRFWNGLIPLIADGGVVAVFLAMLAVSGDEAT